MSSRVVCVGRWWLFTIAVVCSVVFSSCPEPIPLYGTWADNRNNSFTFESEGNFSAEITYSAGTIPPSERFSGTYSVLLNSLTISCNEPRSLRVVTEWDIRGNMLYLDWTNEYGTIPLTLYKTSN